MEIVFFRHWSNPTVNLAQLSYLARYDKAEANIFKSKMGYLKIYPNRGFIVVLYVGDDKTFDPTEFMIIFRKDQVFNIELINGIGEENCVHLDETAARNYLKTHKLDLEELEDIFKKNYCH